MKRFATRRKLLHILSLISVGLLVGYFVFFALQGLDYIIGFRGEALNGAFQLLNPLRRLEAGEVIGRDFHFFHGPLIPLLHYPLYALFGHGLLGSELSRWLMSPVMFFASCSFFLYGWYRLYPNRNRLRLTAISLALVVPLLYVSAEMITPSNSLLGIRTAFPLLVGAAFFLTELQKYTFTYRKLRVSVYEILIYVLLALSLACGTEQGIAAIISYLLFSAVVQYRKQPAGQRAIQKILPTLTTLAKHAAGIAAMILVVFTVISLGHPFSTLHYVLVEVPKDQFWYFGSYPQGFLTFSNLLPALTLPYMLCVYAWLAGFILLLVINLKNHLLTGLQKHAIFFLCVYAAITNGSMLGYFFPSQAYPSVKILVILSVCLALQIIISKATAKKRHLVMGLASLCAASVFVISIGVILSSKKYDVIGLISSTKQALASDEASILSDEWAGSIQKFEADIDQSTHSKNPIIWSTYSSILELRKRQLHPSSQGHDYIIHALGQSRRNQYAQDFVRTKPEFVTTIRPQYSVFEEWLWPRHWDFYKPLLTDYHIIDSGHAHFLWQRNERPNPTPKDLTPLKVSDSTIALPENQTDTYQILEVSIAYSPDTLWTKLPFAKNLPRYLVKPVGTQSVYPISLPPYEKSWTFPIILKPKSEVEAKPYLSLVTQGLTPGAHYTATGAKYRTIETDPKNMPIFSETYVKRKHY